MFNDGFAGAMGELLCAIEDGREPQNSARGNLASILLCQAALRSSRTGETVSLWALPTEKPLLLLPASSRISSMRPMPPCFRQSQHSVLHRGFPVLDEAPFYCPGK